MLHMCDWVWIDIKVQRKFPKLRFSCHSHLLHCHFFLYTCIMLRIFRLSQFSSVAQSCPTLCNPMNCSMPVLPVHHQLPQFTQIHVHRVGWCYPAISSFVVPQSLPASGSFPMSQWLYSIQKNKKINNKAQWFMIIKVNTIKWVVQIRPRYHVSN